MVLKDAMVTRTYFSVVLLSVIFALAAKRIDYLFEFDAKFMVRIWNCLQISVLQFFLYLKLLFSTTYSLTKLIPIWNLNVYVLVCRTDLLLKHLTNTDINPMPEAKERVLRPRRGTRSLKGCPYSLCLLKVNQEGFSLA